MNALQALSMYAEGEGATNATRFNEIAQVIVRHVLEAGRRMKLYPMSDWSAARYAHVVPALCACLPVALSSAFQLVPTCGPTLS
jgi:hypothetical protein